MNQQVSWITDILLLAFFGTLFYFFWLGQYPLFTPDEGRYSEVAREMLVSGDFITPRVNGIAFLDKPVLYYWFQALSMQAFGINEWAIRFFPAMFGLIGCISIYLAGRGLFNRTTGILSAIILATTPLYFCGAHYANLDLEVAVLISISLLFLLAGFLKPQTWRYFLGAYVFAALAFLTKGMIALAFPAMIGGLWILFTWRWNVIPKMRLITGITIFAIIALPWFALVQNANPEFLHYFFVTQQVSRFLSNGTFNNPSPHWFYIPVVLLGSLPWTGFLIPALITAGRDCFHKKQQQAGVLFLLLWAATIFCFFSIPHSKTVSYIFPVLPPLALLTGKYLADRWHMIVLPRGVTTSMYILALLSTILAALLFALPHYQWLDLPLELTPTLFLAASELGIFAITISMVGYSLRIPTLFYLCTLLSIIFLVTLTTGAKYMNPNTAKPLVTPLLSRLQPGDTVINYFKFYQDLPIYLQRTMPLVADWDASDIAERDNWVREFWVSIPFQKTDEILINEKTFWKRWESDEKIYVFLNKNYLKQFLSHTKKYQIVGEYRDILLLENVVAHR